MPNNIGKVKKVKTKETYNEGKQVLKKKTVSIPTKESGVTKNVTTITTRPSLKGYADMLFSRNKDVSDMEKTKSKTVKYTSTSKGRDFPLSPTPQPVSLSERSKKQ
jgi:hypothetical protein